MEDEDEAVEREAGEWVVALEGLVGVEGGGLLG